MGHTAADNHQMISIIFNILLFFGIAGLVIPLLQRIKISPVLGYLLCGIAIGPFGLAVFADSYHWISYITIEKSGTVHLLGELGIVTLMFMIGLELSFDRLKELRHYIFGLGTTQIILTAALIFIVALLFGNSIPSSILLGASLALSSTAIVMKLLEERKLSNQAIGILCFSILLMQDLAVIPILVLASSFSGDGTGNIFIALGSSLLLGACTVCIIFLLGKKALAPLLRSVSASTSPEWLASFVVFIVIACSTMTYLAGLSLALGAFIAGLLIAETEFRHEIEVIINPLKEILLGIFFLSIGMMVNLAEIFHHPILLLLSIIGIYLLKALVMFLLALLFRIPGRQAGESAIYLAQPGEFALMVIGVAVSAHLVSVSDAQFFLLVIVIAMILTPLLFKLAPTIGEYSHSLFKRGKDEPSNPIAAITHKSTIVIAGFGRVGQLIGKVLEERQIPYIAFDYDAKRVQKLKKQNFPIIYGDARKKELWRQLIGEHINAAVIAIDDHLASQNILKSLRAQFPLLSVIVRSEDTQDFNRLYDEGASYVVAETLESSLRIAQIIMEKSDIESEEAQKIIEKIRNR
ncbi:K(+)/H(+) antiporter [Piscirickettsia salmonis]|uniref:K(+)/H(+) antiporter n=1 Tax=Piscirickettsia salmonis TaxID=1238 RepID=A0A9Q6LJJ8_PISSA|nr:cation:proton antiporter [Piscirickettsia salmonis]QGN95033.1 K(+)/H(+) antiporter [Piscirickettsia salmonis]QGO06017.1 K(+)/H(+) antiporter [Piscirickettsia salmonis]QGO34342.1 K(+)/H(+) antiporter [Piscirickettsia salmonis]QGO37949.1 K(+)/H(+) antiporter [Piscirickettsia salmonis]QGO41577.1 K(+)/H(+) antiporter [Piscirickettsia salmonis]